MAERLSRYIKKKKAVEVKKDIRYYLAKIFSDRYANVASFLTTLILGLWGLKLTYENDALQDQMREIATDQYNMAAFAANFQEQERLASIMDAYNNIVYEFSDMESILVYHRLQMTGQITMRNKYVLERAKALETIQKHLQKLGKLDDLIPDKGIGALYSDCLTEVVRFRMLCLENVALGITIDTSFEGQHLYTNVIEKVIRFQDTVMHSLEPEREKLFVALKDGEKLLKEFADFQNQKVEKLQGDKKK